ncbi:SEC23-interacting protein-like isoform X2 [Pseudomyrmex gracilis]|uniref:SEC23-interacting protein-like isoform X2 n=1 Tax=Pseudomyrmex gracilis TaxID=219809 RepID=UPI0009949EE2|nr:SEC23-interacting protein-like isoform X2 [Pseudomyrmex gracilis]
MNGAPRKVKNSLLSAAGPGFPFDSYTENTLLMPVTPATPAVLRDDAELDNFIGQEPVNSQPPSTFEQFSTNAPPLPKESKDAASQPTKPGYFTSILSSLPNLSLSSTKSDPSGLQTNQAFENTGGASHESNPYIPSRGYHDSQSEIPGFLAINQQDSQSADLSGFAAFGPPRPTPAADPPQPAAPPQVSNAPVSYRLGNQRRLKYAPPPDLTSNNAKSYTNPPIQTFFPNQNVSAPPRVILNPYMTEGSSQGNNVQQINSLPEQVSTSEQASLNSSLHNSFRSSPIATTTAIYNSSLSTNQNPFCETSSVSAPSQFASSSLSSSSSRPIPTRVLEPATPQNTPANISFPQFYAPPSDLDKDVGTLKNSNQLNLPPPELTRDNNLVTTVESASDLNPLKSNEESKATFTPLSAAKVTEKLEHLLAKQEETSFVGAATSSEVEITPNVTAQLQTKSSESQSNALQSNKSVDKLYEAKTNDVQGKDVQAGSDTWSDVSLGQESTAQSVICPEVNTADSNPIVTDIQETKSNAPPSQQDYYQDLQPTPIPSSTFYASKPAVQKSSLNYVPPPLQPPRQQSAFYNPSAKPPEQSANLFFESSKQKDVQFSNFPSQENTANISFNKPALDAKYNLQLVEEKSGFSSVATNPTSHVPYWNANQSSQPQILNTTSNHQPAYIAPSQPVYSSQPATTSNEPVYTASSQPVYTASDQSSVPLFYNPAQFTNALPKQANFSHTYDQHSSQQQSYQSAASFYGTGGLQQPYTVPVEDNAAYSSPVTMASSVPEPTGSATLSPVQMSVNSPTNRTTPDTVPPSFQNWASGSSDKRMQYRPLYHHWFYRKEVENKTLWLPFSMQDSLKLEEAHNSSDITPETTVDTDGGRYDVDILRRQRAPVYWTGPATEVRRCSWFYKGSTESRYLPYNESTAAKLEEEYKQACLTNNWNRRIDLNNGEYITFHSATVQAHYLQPTSSELAGSWGNSAGAATRPRVVKRGVDEFNIDEGEPEKVDHLLFLVHGIGSVCDLKFRTVEEVVDEFRGISLQLVQSHYRTACEQGIVNRIEVLPISWHTTLHSEDTGIDKKLQAITLESIPKLRHFTNDTLLDILFYTSPIYCQTIMETVGSEMNRLYALFKERNPNFDGGVYLGGHSLGSLIMFDLLCHQKPDVEEDQDDNQDEGSDKASENDNTGPIQPMPAPVLKRRLSKKISYMMGAAGTGQPYIHYPQLNFHPRAFFALGSPIGMFVTVRGIDTLGEDFTLPTCPAFFNIFHPFDPVAYRVESLINPEAHKFRPMLIPHHKGRKRMHLELKETMARVGADLKQKLIDSVRHTWNSFYQLALFHKPDNQALEREIDKVVEEQLQKTPNVPDHHNEDAAGADLKIGRLNGGRRIDYVLQEAPFEYINEYIFALTSHICYWESEDTMLLILKEIYGSRGIQTDAQLPQQTMSIERISPSPSSNLLGTLSPVRNSASTSSHAWTDPTVPTGFNKPIGPPPTTGFIPKS